MDVRAFMERKGRGAREAARALALSPTRTRNEALLQMARGLVEKSEALLEANRADLERARGRGLARAVLDRLTLSEARVEGMAPGGGGEAIGSNTASAAGLAKAVEKVGAPADAIQFVEVTDRDAVAVLLELDGLVDLVIPRGGEEFVRWVTERSRVPVLKHDKGLAPPYRGAGGAPRGGRGRAARLPPHARARARGAARDRRGLGHGVPRPDPGGPGGGRPRPGARAHPPPRLGAGRGDRHQRPAPRAPVHPGGGRRGRPRERVDAARGRQPVRHGRRDGHLDLAGARPRPGRRPGADDHEVRRAG